MTIPNAMALLVMDFWVFKSVEINIDGSNRKMISPANKTLYRKVKILIHAL